MTEILKAVLLGVIQGVTEWLPVSSTGHMILFDAFLPMQASTEFRSLFLVVIQLFSVLAVVCVYRRRLLPKKKGSGDRFRLWKRILVAALPAAILGMLLDDLIEETFYTPFMVSLMLIIYGVIFLLIEKRSKNSKFFEAEDIDTKASLKIGAFQALSLIPGTSRSGATVIGGLLAGADRPVATEFSFFLAIPIMLGASALRIVKYFASGDLLTGEEWLFLLVGGITAFLVSLVTVRFLSDFVKRHSFRVFGIYRILLGIILLILMNFA